MAIELSNRTAPSRAAYSVIVDGEVDGRRNDVPGRSRRTMAVSGVLSLVFFVAACFTGVRTTGRLADTTSPAIERATHSFPEPISTLDPVNDLSMRSFVRETGKPGKCWGSLLNEQVPIPTNSWWENLVLGENLEDVSTSRVFAIPYVIDTAGSIKGIRTHASGVVATKTIVEQTWNPGYGVGLGTVGSVGHMNVRNDKLGTEASSPAVLGLGLKWDSKDESGPAGAKMSSPVVRGSPYTTMTYNNLRGKVVSDQAPLGGGVYVDGSSELTACKASGGTDSKGHPWGDFNRSNTEEEDPDMDSFLVQKEMTITFQDSDMTWAVFVSSPMHFTCEYRPVLGGDAATTRPYFRLQTSDAFIHGGLRLALVNNCTTGRADPTFCTKKMDKHAGVEVAAGPHNRSAWHSLLRAHAGVYPGATSQAHFAFPTASTVFDPVSGEALSENEQLSVEFDWDPMWFFEHTGDVDGGGGGATTAQSPSRFGTSARPQGAPSEVELLMLSLPHHLDVLAPTAVSTNQMMGGEPTCFETLHGPACPVMGSLWSLIEPLANASFYAPRPIREEVMGPLELSLRADLNFQVDENYQRGAGDTYFSGKELAKLARVVVISDQMGAEFIDQTHAAASRLADGVDVWLKGIGENPFIYDAMWGGLASCGCDFNENTGHCSNYFPDCPALSDMGNNFGFSYFNDHHFHLGYHIYAAAVAGTFNHDWLRENWQRVLLYVRDIANPSTQDPFFPPARHKDWYLGSSWASGVVTIENQPYPNGRNEESSAEAIAAYEAVALLGQAGMMAFDTKRWPLPGDMPNVEAVAQEYAKQYEVASRIYDFGRLLLSTEIRSAHRYWHVRASPAPRVYPDVYEPKVVGMLWSTLAQEQTWFGSEPWKSYGIQLLPFTPVSEKRDDLGWVKEMYPIFNHSCSVDPVCAEQGWSILVLLTQATLGDWRGAFEGIQALPEEVFRTAGGNGHSRSNCLWWIGTRFDPSAGGTPPLMKPSRAPWYADSRFVVALLLAGIVALGFAFRGRCSQ